MSKQKEVKIVNKLPNLVKPTVGDLAPRTKSNRFIYNEIPRLVRYHCIVKTELETNKQCCLSVSTNYGDSLNLFHESYYQYLSDSDYIVREIEPHNILIFKRIIGYIYNSKKPEFSFKILSFSDM